MSIDAMKQALEALESTGLAWPQVKQSIAALCLAIEQAEKPRTWEQFYKPESLNASYEGDDLYTSEQLRAAVAAAVEAECKRINEAHWQFFEERMRARGENT